MRNWTRRHFVSCLASASLVTAATRTEAQSDAPNTPPRFSFDDVVRRARDLASAPLSPPPSAPEQLARLDPDAARDIRFRPERALLSGPASRFRLQTLHLQPNGSPAVTVNLLRDGIPTPIPYSPAQFDYGRTKLERPLPVNLGFAGFRLQFPLNDPNGYDDAVVFTGDNAFRLFGRGQSPGARLRALRVAPNADAFFREFWIEIVRRGAPRAIVHALLDGEAATGAFRLELTPGDQSALDVSAVVFPRKNGGTLGYAPMTSMFLSGENDRRLADGFHPEAHDSDGFALHTGANEWLWRPLRNPATPGQFAFGGANPKGFGLMQRDHVFDHYQDLAAGFERRPSYWVETVGDWGEGRVELAEASAADVGAKNIDIAWVPNAAPDPATPIKFAYRIAAMLDASAIVPLGHVVNTFQAAAPVAQGGLAARRIAVDFAGGDLAYYLGDPPVVEAAATANNGRVANVSVAPNPHINGFRASFEVEIAAGQTADLRVFLRAAGKTISEIWTLPVSA